MVRKITAMLAVFMLALQLQGHFVYAKDTINISQVLDNLPEVVAYVDQTDLDFASMEAFLGSQRLVLNKQEVLSQTNEGTNYYVLVDSSNSIPASYTSAIQNGLINMFKSLRNMDTMYVYTFGAKIKGITSTQDSQSVRNKKIKKIKNDEKQTKLFNAINTIAEKASKNSANGGHSVIVVISDGEDFTTGLTTKKEALKKLQELNIPTYGIAVDSAAKKDKTSFGEFVRDTGGNLTISNADQMGQTPAKIKQKLDQSIKLTYNYGSNKVSNKTELFTIKDQTTRQNASKSVKIIHSVKDTVNPVITDLEMVDEHNLKVIFSENVANAEVVDNYEVKCDGARIKVSNVTYSNTDNQYSATLTFDENLYNGTYSVKCHNIKDASMEANALTDTFEKELKDLKKKAFYQNTWFKGLITALIILGFALLLFLRRKSNKVEEVEIAEVEVEETPKNEETERIHPDPEPEHHTIPVAPVGKKVSMDIIQDGVLQQRIEAVIDRSIIIGRSSSCDYSINNPGISAQHAAIEVYQGDLLITDLNSRNGTFVNDVKLVKPIKLNPYDLITIGTVTIQIRW